MVARRAAAAGVQAAIEAAGGRRGTAGGRGIDAATGPAAGRGAGPAAGRGAAPLVEVALLLRFNLPPTNFG